MDDQKPSKEPTEIKETTRWSWTTKLTIGLILGALGLLLVVRFQNFIGPLLTSFLIAYHFQPLAKLLNKYVRIGWRTSVLIVYLLFALILIGLITWGGVTIVTQFQNLISFIQENLPKIPQFFDELAQNDLVIGPIVIDTSPYNWEEITAQIVGAIQPILTTAGGLMGKLLSGSANIIFWFFVTYLVSFFFLSESNITQGGLTRINIPGYVDDMNRMSQEISRILSSFIRGELLVVLIAILIFSVYLGAMGLNFFFGLALIAGLGRFIPYLGAWISWISFGLVALLQPSNIFNLLPIWYAVLVVGIALVIDTTLDNLLVPKVMGNALKVHPAAVLLAALILANLVGVIGIILAAPVYAILQLLLKYLIAKMADKDPWQSLQYVEDKVPPKWLAYLQKLWRRFCVWVRKQFAKRKGQANSDQK